MNHNGRHRPHPSIPKGDNQCHKTGHRKQVPQSHLVAWLIPNRITLKQPNDSCCPKGNCNDWIGPASSGVKAQRIRRDSRETHQVMNLETTCSSNPTWAERIDRATSRYLENHPPSRLECRPLARQTRISRLDAHSIDPDFPLVRRWERTCRSRKATSAAHAIFDKTTSYVSPLRSICV